MDLPRIGQPAPDFQGKAVLNDKVFDTSLSDYRGKYLVLLFFPLNFTYVCPTELVAFSDHVKEFQELNTVVVACSVESIFSHTKWLSIPHREGGIRGLGIPLLADKSMAITKKYGVLDAEEGTSYRALFIIDDKGILRQITINDRPVGRHVAETFRLIKDLQKADKLRETTPNIGFFEVFAPSTQKPRSLICAEKSLLHELIE